MTEPTVNVENATIERPQRVVAASISMPDHPIRQSQWYQLFERLWRPALGWIACPITVLYAGVIAPASGNPLQEGYLIQLLTFSGAVYGVKTLEKIKGVS